MKFTSDQLIKSVILNRSGVPSFDDYPFCIPCIKDFEKIDLHPKVTFFIGENGAGKSTLMEAIAVASGFNPEGGSRNVVFSTHESHSKLFEHLTLRRGIRPPRDGYFLRAESFYNVATYIEQNDSHPDHNSQTYSAGTPIGGAYGGRSLHEQSHGESFWTLLTQRFRGNGLYLLDEPEAALSPTRQMGVLSAMHELIKKQSQFIIVTHSPIIMAYPDAAIYLFSKDGIKRVEYTETEHYTVTLDFLSRYEMMLKLLLSNE